MNVPVFKSDLYVETIPGEGVLLLSEKTARAFYGTPYELVVPLIDGHRTADDIVDALSGRLDAATAYYTLATLEKRGVLSEAAPEIPPEQAAFWHGLGLEPRAALAALEKRTAALFTVGELAPDAIAAALQEAGVRLLPPRATPIPDAPGAISSALSVAPAAPPVVSTSPGMPAPKAEVPSGPAVPHAPADALKDAAAADLWVVVADDYLRDELHHINRAALAAKKPWLLVRPTGPEAWIGPLFLPGRTACFQCLASRLERNRPAHVMAKKLGRHAAFPSTSTGAFAPALGAACRMAAVAAAQFLAGASAPSPADAAPEPFGDRPSPCGPSTYEPAVPEAPAQTPLQTAPGAPAETATGADADAAQTPPLADRLVSLDWTDWTPGTHVLTRNPHCPACGAAAAPAQDPPAPPALAPAKATFTSDGGHRLVAPEKTIRRFEHLVGPITGIVRELTPLPLQDEFVSVFSAGHNTALRMENLASLRRSLRSCSSGKGASETQARASALCEAIERYSGEWRGSEPRVARAFADWPEGQAIHPNDIMHYSERQYAERDRWNERGSKFNKIPLPLGPETVVNWTPLWSLTEGRHKYLPSQLVYFRAPAADGDDTPYAFGCSNGNASGNTLAEAALQGFFELVERDATAIWWYNRLPCPGVALESFDDPWLPKLADHYLRRYRRQVWALDITSDLGIPAFAAVSRLVEGPMEQLYFGLGCHLDARIALQRSFAEMNQLLSLGSREDVVKDEMVLQDPETLSWMRTATLANKPYMAPDPAAPRRTLSDHPVQHTGNFLEDLALCRGRIEAAGMEMLLLDQTRPDTGMPVAKVVVPGLRHFWARFAPGRLYAVPVRTGRLSVPLREEELNPVPVFF